MLALTTYEPPPTIRALDKETVASGGAVSGDVVQIHTCGCGANGRWLRSIHGWIEAKSNVTVPSGSIPADAEMRSAHGAAQSPDGSLTADPTPTGSMANAGALGQMSMSTMSASSLLSICRS